MTDVPVIKIEIDDAEYRAFQDRVRQFRAEEAEAPAAWAGTAEQVAIIQKRFEELSEAASRQDEGARRTRDNVDSSNRATVAIVALWGFTHPHVKAVAGSIMSGTRELAKWERMTAVFSALVGAGGLYGLDTLAASASSRRKRATGAGVSTGELAAFQTDYGRLGNTDALLEGFNRAAIDRMAQQPLQSLGVDPRGKNAAQLFAEALPRIQDLAKRTDPTQLGPTLRATHLDQLGVDENTFRLLRRMSREEVAGMIRDAKTDAPQFEIPDDIGRKWQDLENQLTRAGNEIQTALAGLLVNVTPGVTKVSDSLVKLVDTLMARPELKTWLDRAGHGMEDLAKWAGSKDAKDGLKKAVDNFKMTRDDFDQLNRWFDANGRTLLRLAQGILGAKVGGSLFGPAGAAAGFAIGATGNLPTHVEGAPGYRVGDDGRQRQGGAAAERPTLEQRNAERRGLGLPEYKTQEDYDKAELPAAPNAAPQHPVGPQSSAAPPSAAPGSPAAYNADIAGDMSASSTYSRAGEKITPEAFVVHHTGGRGTPQGVENTLNQRGLGVQYVMDRDGKVYRALPEGSRAAHILPSEVKGLDLSNDNTFGMEVIANNDADVTPEQVASARKFYKDLKAAYPSIKEAYGHGYLNPGHKQATEGKTITDAIRADERAAPPPAISPAQAGASAARNVPVEQRGFMGSAYRTGDIRANHPNNKAPLPPAVTVTDNSGGASQVAVHQ